MREKGVATMRREGRGEEEEIGGTNGKKKERVVGCWCWFQQEGGKTRGRMKRDEVGCYSGNRDRERESTRELGFNEREREEGKAGLAF